jgi:hypothetical protein
MISFFDIGIRIRRGRPVEGADDRGCDRYMAGSILHDITRCGGLGSDRTGRLAIIAYSGRHGFRPGFMPYSDPDASAFNLKLGQVIAFEKINQVLDLLRVGRGVLSAFGSSERARQDDGRCGYAGFAWFFTGHRTRST